MHDSVKTILASVMIFEEVTHIKGTQYLDRDDVRENAYLVKKWLKKYSDKEMDLTLLREVLASSDTPFRGDLLEHYKEISGEESSIVTLQELSGVRPCRAGLLKEHMARYDMDYVMQGVTEAYNRMGDRKSAKLTDKEKVRDLAIAVRKYDQFMSRDDSKAIDSQKITTDEESNMLEGAKLTAICWPMAKVHVPLRGVFEKSLNFVAAPQGSYKTKFLVQMAAHNVVGGQNVAYISAEMDQAEMLGCLVFSMLCYTEAWKELCGGRWHKDSLLCSSSGSLPQARVLAPDFYSFLMESLRNPSESGFGRLIVKDTTSMPGLEEIIDYLEETDLDMRNAEKDDSAGLDAVFLDYLGIFDVPKDIRKKSQDERGEWLAGTCKKRLAMGFCGRGIPVISAHQVNREGQKRVDKKEGGDIKSYDLAGSGWIERYADSCVVLRKLADGMVQIHSVKSRRSGDIDPFTCAFNPSSMNLDEGTSTPVDKILADMAAGLPLELDM